MYDDFLTSRREPGDPALNKKLTLKEQQAQPHYPRTHPNNSLKTPDIPIGVDPWAFTYGLKTEPKQLKDQSRLLSILDQKINDLSLIANPEYSADITSDIEALGGLLKLSSEIQKEQDIYNKEYMKQPAQLTPSEQQARDLKGQVDTAGSKILSTIFDPSPYADYAGMVEAITQKSESKKQYDTLVNDD